MRLALNALDPHSYFDVAPGQLSSDGGPYRLIINDLLRDWSVLSYEAGDEDDTIIYDSDRIYASELLSFASGGGNDELYIGRFYVGSVAVSAGAGDDVVILAHVEGSSGGYVDAGEGDDLIRVRASFGAVGMFGNSVFDIIAGSGNDLVELEGIQINLLGAAINTVDGGAGFDSFAWNLSYDLGHGTDQTGIDATNPPLLREIGISNFEELIVSAPRVGSSLRLTAADVALITQSSLFDRSELGLGLSGTGNTLFLRSVGLPVALDLSGWSLMGETSRGGIDYDLFSDGGALLAVEQAMFTATEPPRELWIDHVLGGSISVDDLLSTDEPVVTWRLTDQAGNEVDYYHWDPVRRAVVIDDWPEGLPELNLRLEAHFSDGSVRTRDLFLRASDLSFTSVEAGSEFLNVAIGDVNGDGRLEPFGTFRQEDGSFLTMDVEAHGLSVIFAEDRVDRDHRLVDLDNDGDLDLIATTYALSTPGPNIAYMFSNDGQGYFTEIPSFTALGVQGFGETIVAADFDNDGLTDLYLPYYFRDDTLPGGIPSPVAGSRFFLNQGGMAFSDATEAWDIVNDDGSLSLKGFGSFYNFMPEGAHALDINSDGLIDLFVAGHLFLNLGGSFYDANTALGLPTEFEEGALLFDWNNDGYFDYLAIPPHEGPILFQFNPSLSRFEQVFAFPSGVVHNEVYGIQAGDLNGDGWEDVVAGRGHGVPRIFLNQAGQSYVEYRSLSTENFDGFAPVVGDLTGDGQPDLIVGDGGGIFANSSTEPGHVVTVTLLGPNGEMNQHGRVVKLEPIDPADTRILTRAVDSGRGYMAQGFYEIQFTDSAANAYRAHAHIIDYATGAPIVVTFVATSGHAYVVRAPSGSQAAQVSDAATGEPVLFTWAFSFAVNQAPIFDVMDETIAFVEGDDPVQPFSSVSVRDLNSSNYDGGSLTVSLSGGGQQGDRLTLSLSDQAGTGLEVESGVVRYNGQIIGSIASSDTEMTIELSQLADNAALQALVEAVRFATVSDDPGSGDRSVSVRLRDGGGTANAGEDSIEIERTIAVAPVNDVPSGADASIVVDEDMPRILTQADFGFSDPDGTFASVTINGVTGGGKLYYDADGALGAGDPAEVGAFPQTYTAAELDQGRVLFVPNLNVHGNMLATLSFNVTDNLGAADASANTLTFNVTPLNDAPNGTSATITGTEDAVRILFQVDFGFTDPDIGDSLSAVTITGVAGGTLYFNSGGSSVAVGSFPQTYSAGDIAAGHLSFLGNPNLNGAGAATITFQVIDNSGAPNATDPVADTLTVDLTAVNDKPVLSSSPPVTAGEDIPAVKLDPAITVSDIDLDARNGGAGDYAGAQWLAANTSAPSGFDLFAISESAGFTVSGNQLLVGGFEFATFTGGNGTQLNVFFTGAGTPATTALVNEVARAITYAYTGNNPPASIQVAFGLDDGAPTHGQGSADPPNTPATYNFITVTITPFPDGPLVALEAGNTSTTIAYTENSPATALAPAGTVTDPDSADFNGGTIIAAFTANGTADDAMSVVSQGNGANQVGVSGTTLSYGGSPIGTVTGGGGGSALTISFTTNVAPAVAEAVLRQIVYFNGSEAPSTLARTVSFTLTDGDGGTSVAATATINFTAVDDAPVAQPDAVTTNEATILIGSAFADNGSGPDSDVDNPLQVSAVNGSAANVGTQIALASGALLTLNANGAFSYNPNHVFDSMPTAGSGASNTPFPDSFTYTLTGGGTVTVSVTVTGLDSNDVLLGTAGADTLSAGIGNDYIDGLAGADSMTGAAGNDVYIVDNAGDLVIETSGGGNDTIYTLSTYQLTGGSHVETLAAIDNSLTTALALIGNEFANTIYGNNGANYIDGGAGADALAGFGGDDAYVVDNVADRVFEDVGRGNDVVYATASYALGGGSEIETLAAQDNSATTALALIGNEFANTIYGNNGDNFIDGNAGADALAGFGGNDAYVVDNTADRVFEDVGRGNDIVYATASFALGGGSEIETLAAQDNSLTTAINLVGNEFANAILGNAGANYIDGNLGADVLRGFGGDDAYVVDQAGDIVIEGAGGGNDSVYALASYTLGAGVSVETLSVTDNSAVNAIDLIGNELANSIIGNNGANILNGGGGNDVLRGFGGADTFAFTSALGAGNVDAILDFVSGTDKIALDDAGFAGLGLGALNPNAFVTGPAAADADDRILYNAATGALFYDADGNGAGAAIQFATLTGAPALAAGDFTVI